MFECVDDVRIFDVRMKRNHILKQKTTDLHLKNRNKKEVSF